MKRGDILEFKRKGFVSWFLGGLLGWFERDWDKWGWHLGIAYEKTRNGWYVLEAQSPVVNVNYYSNDELKKKTRSWTWLDKEPSIPQMDKFLQEHNNKKYDVLIYFWTTLQYLIRHYLNRRIPRLLDDQWTCWELVVDYCDFMGKPIQSRFDCPLITDILRNLKSVGDDCPLITDFLEVVKK